ncbi:MAG: hypothetical protein M3Q17_10165 [Actinomycetota bacterium]|nr:hypothetical protein [Actinomycetota bacterium]
MRRRAVMVSIGLCWCLLVVGLAGGVPVAADDRVDRPDAVTGDRPSDERGQFFIRAGTLRWRSPKPLPVTDARPEFRVGSRVVGYPELGGDGRTLSLSLSELGGYAPHRVQVWLGPQRLDLAGARTRTARPDPIGVGPTVTPTRDPATPGAFEVRSFDYRSAVVPFTGYAAPLEVLGHAVLPKRPGPAPLVLFLHGRHQACYGGRGGDGWPCGGTSKPVPSYLGYDYSQQSLASQGYATVSISANAINAQDFASFDGGARARSVLVRHHLELLASWSADPTSARWAGALDMEQVVLVGHSRGGEGVDQAAIDANLEQPYRITGQVLIAPTDFAYQTAAYVPTAVLLPYCDGDVYDLQGQRFVDAARDLTADDTSLRSSVLIRGANHNFFNTEWTPGLSQAPSFDDWFDRDDPVCGRAVSDTRLRAGEQRATGSTFVAAAVRAFVGSQPGMVRWLDSARPLQLPWAGDAVAWTHALGGGRRSTVVPGDTMTTGGAARLCTAVRPANLKVERAPPACGLARWDRQVHWSPRADDFLFPETVYGRVAAGAAAEVSWQAPGAVGVLTPQLPFRLGAADAALDLRVIAGPRRTVRFAIRLSDGDSAWTSPQQVLRPFPGGRNLAPLWARSVRVAPSSPPSGLDLDAITEVEIVTAGDTGRLWVLDASVRRNSLAAVPDRRLPRISLGQATVTEGDGLGAGVAEVPFRVRGEVTRRGWFAVGITHNSFGPRAGLRYARIPVPRGATRGVVAVRYERDTLDDVSIVPEGVVAVPGRNVSMNDYLGRLRIRDDDPAPDITLRPQDRAISYGERLAFRLEVSEPVDYQIFARGKAVAPKGARALRTSDLPRRWARRHVADPDADVSLVGRLRVFFSVPRGSTTATFSVPTRSRPLHPGPKALTLSASTGRGSDRLEATVRVR